MPGLHPWNRHATAFGLATEMGAWHRLTGRTIGSHLGLVPSEYSSGNSRAQGAVTKTGNAHARRLLVEAPWHLRRPYRLGTVLRRRWELASPAANGPIAAAPDTGLSLLRWSRFRTFCAGALGAQAIVSLCGRKTTDG